MTSTLPYVERGLFTFIGATTENPSFEVINALLSRATVYVLHPLTEAELGALFDRTRERVMPSVRFSDAARSLVIGFADGDARRLLNMLEQLHIAAEGMSEIDEAFAKNALTQSLRRFDKGGDQFYDQISALHKSVRGSSPDAALYWLVRMLDGGADPWAARAWHDLFAALGVKPLEEYEGGALFHPVDVANMLKKIGWRGWRHEAARLRDATSGARPPGAAHTDFELLERSGPRKRPVRAARLRQSRRVEDGSLCYARHLYGPGVTVNGPYRELVNMAMKKSSKRSPMTETT